MQAGFILRRRRRRERQIRAKPKDSGWSGGFAPVARPDATRLILGSLPGRRSLAAGEYYAHPANAFWPIMRALVGAEGDYTARCGRLMDAGIALWDVLRASQRPGSLDADIRAATSEPNDFEKFFRRHPEIGAILFNGRQAERMFLHFVRGDASGGGKRLVLLPSTSPANAGMPFAVKLERWRGALASTREES